MTIFYVQTTGLATNSGSSDTNAPKLTGASGATGVAVAGTTVTFPAGTDLSTVVTTAGDTQDTIYIADATNSNRKIFKITAVAGSGGATPTATVDTAPTGTIATSQWSIGGRHIWTSASIEAATLAGDIVQFGDDVAPANAVIVTVRVAGDSTSGFVKYRGKPGTRPKLTATGTTNVFASAVYGTWIENLELIGQGASGSGMSLTGNGAVVINVKVSDAGTHGIDITGQACRILNCELTGVGSNGINTTGNTTIIGCYIHDVGQHGIQNSSTTPGGAYLNNIVDTAVARGIFISGAVAAAVATHVIIAGNTIYGCGNSGFEVTDTDVVVVFVNNLLMNNGDAAGESNIEWANGTAERLGVHGWNVAYNNSGADAPINFTANAQVPASEFTTDPLMTNPAAGDFTIAAGSPARATGQPVGLLT